MFTLTLGCSPSCTKISTMVRFDSIMYRRLVRHGQLSAAGCQGLAADVGVASSVMSVCARAQQVQHAITVFKHLHQRGLRPEATAFNALLQV